MSASVKLEINPNILIWIKKQLNSPDIVSTLDKWINQEESPTFSKLQSFSQKAHIPFGYFFLNTPPKEELDIAHCRTINSSQIQNASRELIDTFNLMRGIKDWMSDYNQHNALSPLSFVGRFNERDNIDKIVHDIRQVLNLMINWFYHLKNSDATFKFLRNKISDLGVIIIQNSVVGTDNTRPLNIKEFRAFTLIDNYAPLIFINNNDSVNGKIFSLLHELAHIWIGQEDLFNDNHLTANDNFTEKVCNAIAAELLVPQEILSLEWKKNNDSPKNKIKILTNIFKCSALVIARRALDLQLIEKSIYDYFVDQNKIITEVPLRKKNGGNFYNTLKSRWDKKVIMALDSSSKSGEIQYLDAYRLTNLKGPTFHKLVQQMSNLR